MFKHVTLLWVLNYLKKKDKPFFALDTHAGIGRYDFHTVEAQKTQEFAAGVLALAAVEASLPPPLQDYLAQIRLLNTPAEGPLRIYPGSPLLIAQTLRPQDRLLANELHPEDVQTLRQTLRSWKNTRVTQQDAYECLKACLPPEERRGVVLIDPPFEVLNEFDLMLRGLTQALRRWKTGIYLLWYPIKSIADVTRFHAEVRTLSDPELDIIAADFYLHRPTAEKRLCGTGLVIVNPPWGLEEDLQNTIFPALRQALSPATGSWTVTSLCACDSQKQKQKQNHPPD